ncbi:MAG: hypothetical protein IKP42_04385 [Ruminococcus sp.]|nr:hypothetical protein [Ruminococcus sp.]
MLDIMRSQFRTMTRKTMVHILGVLLLAASTIMLFMNNAVSDDTGSVPTATEIIPETATLIMSLAMFGTTFVASIIAGDDFLDKTINNELIAGRRRYTSYFGRAIPVMIAGPLISIALCTLPYVIYGAVNGFGDTLPVGNLILRVAVGIFPLIRLSAFCVMVLFLFRNPIGAVMSNMAMPMMGMAVVVGGSSFPFLKAASEKLWLVSPINFVSLGKIESWYTYDLELETYYTYSTAIPASDIVLTIISSVVMTAVYLIIGYHYFHVDDLE